MLAVYATAANAPAHMSLPEVTCLMLQEATQLPLTEVTPLALSEVTHIVTVPEMALLPQSEVT